MNLSRRDAFARFGALSVAGAVLAACATHLDAATLASDTKFAADAFSQFAADVSAFGLNIPASVLAQVNKLAADVQDNAAGIADALNQGDVLNKIKGFVTLAGALLAPYFAKAPAYAAAFDTVVQLFVDVAARYGFTLTKAAAAHV